ncbi:hypothetical protein SAMN05216571_105175 [Onishia taeanensis]|jgi:hypothetical protein|uniref:Uncharacterized protein n=1 Tax=Onishia taeanensis TaxID=284577 RepID=A0A1G7S2H6_9GAMM|nr:hypothetical protein [Halomonas taeanensis]MAX32955.1 hypothetical protein [Halomonadaceae bacterium]SDG17222.1 hypothetical protein SAMN05216571_105175 [Halomonas taeanensis]
MRNLLLMRRPLPRGLLVSLHLFSQLGMLVTGGLWTREALAPLATTPLSAQWPTLGLGVGATLAACLLVRVLFELLMTPHHVQAMIALQRLPFTRSTRRRPAVHDEDDSWVGEARQVNPEATAPQPEAFNAAYAASAAGAAAAAAPLNDAPASAQPSAGASWPREPQLDLAAPAWTDNYAPTAEPRL